MNSYNNLIHTDIAGFKYETTTGEFTHASDDKKVVFAFVSKPLTATYLRIKLSSGATDLQMQNINMIVHGYMFNINEILLYKPIQK